MVAMSRETPYVVFYDSIEVVSRTDWGIARQAPIKRARRQKKSGNLPHF
jgi:hypothetical protein